jgi:RNA polymerase primary sigma factor
MTGTTEAKKSRKKSVVLPTTAPGSTGTGQQNEGLDPSVIKLIDYAKAKKEIFFEELADYLPEHIANTDKIEQVLTLLAENNIQVIEEDLSEEEETEPAGRKADPEKKRLVYNE